MTSLFRPEALAARSQSALGRVQLVRPLSLSWLTLGAALMLVAVLVFLSLAGYTRKATVAGVLLPDRGLIRLVPAASGVVLQRNVVEGRPVRAGEVLFVVSLDRALFDAGVQARVQATLDERRRSLEASAGQQRGLVQTQQAALSRRLQALALEAAQLDTEASLQRERLTLAQQSLARFESLQKEQFFSPAQVQTKREEVLGVQSAVQALERQRATLERERAELEGQLRALPLQAGSATGGIERDLAALAREAAELDAERQFVVRAPQAGTIGSVLAEPGQSVSPASALASLVPEGSTLQAHLYAPSSAIGFVRPGQTVHLRYEAFPYQKFGHATGRVLQVGRTPLAAAELAALAAPVASAGGSTGQPLFRITVELDPPPAGRAPLPLVAGMRLSADVLLERRRLLEWLFEPLLAWRARST